MNIVFAWLDLYDRPNDALEAINDALGSRFNTGNLTQWRKEQKGLQPATYNFMLQQVAEADGGIDYQQLRMPDPKNPQG